jgi:two-component system, NtrC family, response regulator HydG
MKEKSHQVWNSRLLNHIVDSMADGVFTMDIKGRICSWNPAMEKITGYTESEAMGRSCDILACSRCFNRACPTSFKDCGILRHGKAEDNECLVQHKDGYDIPVIKCARAVRDENGTIIGVVETVKDLTELKTARLKAEEATRRLREMHAFGNIIGKSDAIQQVFRAIEAAATSSATILIRGESGTGKELVAGAIHYNSPLADKPFITVNCSALSESLLESELFGHARGSFTGALRDRIGRFEEATGGTIFLDEIGEVSPFIQVKLLRVLQEREIERVGESRKRKIDIRVIAATHQDLYDRVREGRFREDLYYRLKVFPIQIPPLRKRKEDIPLLVNHFLQVQNNKTGKDIHSLSSSAMRIMMDYSWPGNVRELENAIEHAFVLCHRDQIDIFELPAEIREKDYHPVSEDFSEAQKASAKPRRKLRRETLLELLEGCDWNKAEVARRVGLSRTAIWKYMKKWDIPLKQP